MPDYHASKEGNILRNNNGARWIGMRVYVYEEDFISNSRLGPSCSVDDAHFLFFLAVRYGIGRNKYEDHSGISGVYQSGGSGFRIRHNRLFVSESRCAQARSLFAVYGPRDFISSGPAKKRDDRMETVDCGSADLRVVCGN